VSDPLARYAREGVAHRMFIRVLELKYA